MHTVFRAVGPVERGPVGLIEALGFSIGPQGTLVMPSSTGDDDQPFDPARTPARPDLGVTAEAFWRLPEVVRSCHPFAFAAKGPRAAEILADGLMLPPHQRNSPVGKVLDHDGRFLLLGLDHDANTTLQLAETLDGVPYGIAHHITVRRDDKPVRLDYFENDHCCQGFRSAEAWLTQHGVQSVGNVGHAPSKLMRSRDQIDTALPHLTRSPFTFLHPRDSDCEECAEAWKSVPE